MPKKKTRPVHVDPPAPVKIQLYLDHATVLSQRCPICRSRLLKQALATPGLVSVTYCGQCAPAVGFSPLAEPDPMLQEPVKKPRKRKPKAN